MNKHTIYIIKVMLLIILAALIVTSTVIIVKGENGASGFTVISASIFPVPINGKITEDSTIRIQTATGGGEIITGKFGNSSLSKFLPEFIFGKQLEIKISNVKEIAYYQILSRDNLIKFEYHYIDAPDFWGAKCDGSDYCFPMHTDRFLGAGHDKILAINRTIGGKYGGFGYPDISKTAELKVTINGTVYIQAISSGDMSTGSVNFKLKNGKYINVKTLGNFDTGQSVPNQEGYVATSIPENNKWKIAPITYYDRYNDFLIQTDTVFNEVKSKGYGHMENNNFIPYCTKDLCTNVLQYILTHNANLKTLTDKNDIISYNSDMSTSSKNPPKNDIVNGNIVSIKDKVISNLVLLITAPAMELDVHTFIGIPDIISTKSELFSSGDGSGNIKIEFKNIGHATGTFAAYLSKNDKKMVGLSNMESTKTTVEKGDTGVINIHIDGMTNERLNETINVTVYDINNPDNTASKSVELKMDVPKLCKPDSYRLYGNKVYECNENGTEEFLVMDCNGVVDYTDGNYVCQEENNIKKTNEESKSVIQSKQNITENEKQKEGGGIFIYTLYWILCFLVITSLLIIISKLRNEGGKLTKQDKDKSLIYAGIVTGLLFVYIKFVELSESLGVTLWLLIFIILIIVLAGNLIFYIKTQKTIPLYISVGLIILIFIISTSILSGLKDIMCDSWLTRWTIGNCEKFDLIDYLL